MNAQVQTLEKNGLTESAASVAAMDAAMTSFGRQTIDDLLAQQDELVGAVNEAGKIDDAVERAKRLEIINSKMDALMPKIMEYREDTAELIAGLEATFNKLGIDLSSLQKPTEEDLAIIVRAENHFAELKNREVMELASLTQVISEAETGWNPLGKQARITEAKTSLEAYKINHKTALAEAEVAIDEAKAEVARLKNKRIREADFDLQFTRFIDIAKQIQTKLLENVTSSEIRMVETRASLNEALKQKEQLATDIEALDAKIIDAEQTVLTLEKEVSSAIDQKSRSTKQTALGAASQILADLNGTKQEMQVAFNAFESAATKHGLMLDTLQVQCDNQRSHARKLGIDSKARFVQAQNLVGVIRNTMQEDAASKLHSVGSSLDRTSLEVGARALIASERARLEMYKGHAADMLSFSEITGAVAEGRAGVAIEDAEIAARMQKNFGINPLDSSWLNLAEQMGNSEERKAA